jgi:hydrogenase small subunit
VVRDFASRAKAVMCVGTCAAWGGISATPPNPTGVVGVQELTGRETINVSGCPPHPDWIVWTLARILMDEKIELDAQGRPLALYAKTVHFFCPRKFTTPASGLGTNGRCLKDLGCRGGDAGASCPDNFFNGGRNWCVRVNSPCIGCTRKGFPFDALYRNGIS